MDNKGLFGDLRDTSNQGNLTGPSNKGVLEQASGLAGDLTYNRNKQNSINKFNETLVKNNGKTLYGTTVRYVGNDPNIARQKWAIAGNSAYNFNKNVGDSGISFDDKTGKITIKATDVIKNSDWYKNQYVNNSTFKQVAKLYAMDPTGSTGIQVTDKDGNVEDITVKDWLEREAEAFDKYASEYGTKIVPQREKIEEASDGRIILSDNDAMISLNSTNKEKSRYDNTFAIYLPDVITLSPKKFGLDQFDSYNAEEGTISAKDFYDWYTVKADGDDIKEMFGEALKRATIFSLTGGSSWSYYLAKDAEDAIENGYTGPGKEKIDAIEAMEIALTSSIARILNDPEVTETDKKNLARSLALLETLSNDRPDTDFLVNASMFRESAVMSAVNTLISADINLFSAIETGNKLVTSITSLNNTSGKVLAVATLGTSVAYNQLTAASMTASEFAKAKAYDIGSIIASVDNNPEEGASINGLMALGEMYAGLTTGNGVEAIQKWADITNTPFSLEAQEIVTSLYAEHQGEREAITKWAINGRFIGNIIGEIVKQTILTNVIGGMVGSLTSNLIASVASKPVSSLTELVNGFKYLDEGLAAYLWGQKTPAVANTFIKATELLTKGGGYAANLMAQGVVDTILNDAEILDRLISNPDEEARHAFYDAYTQNLRANIFGEMTGAAFKGTGKAIGYAARKSGTAAFFTRLTSRAGAMKHTAIANFSEWMAEGNSKAARFFDKIFKASDSTSKWWSDLHWKEAESLFNIANAAKGTKTVSEATLATQKAVINRMELEVAMNNVTRGTMRMWQRIVTNDAISKQYKAVNDAYSDLLAVEGKAGRRKIGEVISVSQETSDYIALKVHVDRLNLEQAQLEANGKTLSKKKIAYKEGLENRISKYVESHSKECVNAANAFLNKFRAYEFAYMNLASKSMDAGGLGIYDKETIKGYRSTGYWGETGDMYVPLVRVSSGDEAGAAMKAVDEWSSGGGYKAKLSVDAYELKPGDIDAHYLDPQMTIYAQQVTAAKVYNAREWGNVLLANDSKAMEIDVTGKAVTLKEVANSRSHIRNIAEKTLDLYKKQGDIMNYRLQSAYSSTTKSNIKRSLKYFRRAIHKLDGTDMMVLRMSGVPIREIPTVNSYEEITQFVGTLSKKEGELLTEYLNGRELTVDNFNKIVKETDFSTKLQRNALIKNKDALSSDAYKEYVEKIERNINEADRALVALTTHRNYRSATIQNFLKTKGMDDFTVMVNDVLDDLITVSDKELLDNKFLNEMLAKYESMGVSRDVAKRYLILQEYKKLFETKAGKAQLENLIQRNLDNLELTGDKTTQQTILGLKQEFQDAFKSNLESKWAAAANDLEAAGGKELLDTEDIYNYIYTQMSDFIDTTLKSPNVVQVLDGNGQFHYYQLSPTTANLYTTRPDFSGGKKGLWGFFNNTNRLGRLGNVGWSIKSFMNQWIKDPLDAFLLGGFNTTITTASDEIGELLGNNVVDRVIREIGEAGWNKAVSEATEAAGRNLSMDELTALAKQKLPSSADVVSDAYEAVGKEGAETKYYREMSTGYREEMWGKFKQKQTLAEKAMSFAESHSLGNTRETYLRRAVYVNAYRDALAMGRTTKEASTVAEFTMQNATTNFSRQFAFGNHIVSSIPFFGAALNGSASFWRLLEVDPVGISTRFISGLVLPTLSIIGQSVQDPSDREVYKTFTEYEKESNLCFVVDGEKFKIPMPEEIIKFITPFRHVAEKAMDVNDHNKYELMLNDLLGIFPIEISSFVGLDENTLSGDPTLMDRMSWVGSSLVAQLSPNVVKTLYMARTGIDPYTGASIDKSSSWVDEDGNSVIVDNTNNAFLQWFSAKLKEMDIDLSPSSMHALLQTLMGNAGIDIFDSLTQIFSGEYMEVINTFGNQFFEPFESKTSKDPNRYNLKQAFKELEKKKEVLMNDKEFYGISNKISQLDPADKNYEQKKQELIKKRREKIQAYQDEVFNVVKNYQKQFGSTYDRGMFASTIALLTFNRDYSDGLLESEHERMKEGYYYARNSAIQTMQAYGFTSPNDLSIFGYMATNKYGEAVMKTNQPLAIMNLSSQVWGQTEVDLANIAAMLDRAGIDRKGMFGDGYTQAKNAGKAALKQYKSDWNKKVVKALAPYVDSRGVEPLLNGFETRDMLDNYIFVDNPYKTKEYLTAIFGG